MIDPRLDAQYDNRARVPGHPAILAGWARDAAAFREEHPPEVLAYGEDPRQRVDLFAPDGAGEGPAVLLLHGGYWQALDRSFASHLAGGALARGLAVGVAGYRLCPQVALADVVEDARGAALALHRRLGRPVLAAGHSAGGHLAACLLATDWVARGAPPAMVPAALAVSGLFDLAPLVATRVNGALRLDGAEAARLSPLRWPAPIGAALEAWVGEAESEEYQRQTSGVVAAWGAAGVAAHAGAVPGADHFTVVASLAGPEGLLTGRLDDLARRVRAAG